MSENSSCDHSIKEENSMMPAHSDLVRQRMAEVEKEVRAVRMSGQEQPKPPKKPRPFWIVLITLLAGSRKK